MANIWEKAISILAGNLNSGRSYLITTVVKTYLVTSLPKMTGEVANEFEAAVLLDFIHLREGGRKKLLVFRFRGKPLLFPFPVVSVLHLLPAADKPATPDPLPTILEVTPLDVKVFISSNVLIWMFVQRF